MTYSTLVKSPQLWQSNIRMKLRLLAFFLLLSAQLSADICLPGRSCQNDRNEITEEQDAELAHLLELFHGYMDLGVLERAQETLTRLHKLIESLPGESAAPCAKKKATCAANWNTDNTATKK